MCHTVHMGVEASPTRRTTSFDVARAAGVSRSTVSQVLNGDLRFPAETRAKVIAAAESLDYRPSRAGRALVTGLSDLVVVLVPHATFGSHLQDSIDRITSVSAASGLSVVVRFGHPDDEGTLNSVLDLRPTAVVDLGVLSQAQRAQLERAGIRSVPSASREQRAGEDADPFDILIGRLQVQELVRRRRRLLVYAAPDAALGEFPINGDGRNGADAEVSSPAGNGVVSHVADGDLARGAGDPLHELDGLVAAWAAGGEDLNVTLGRHCGSLGLV